MPTRDRAELVRLLSRAVRDLSGQSVVFSEAVAEKVGMNATDLECLGFLADAGGMPAGRLAEMTGLTTGAVTRMIDRLEKAGYVQRVEDPDDRRRVIVQPLPERMQTLAPFFEHLARALSESLARYDKEELALLLDWHQKGSALVQAQIGRIRGLDSGDGSGPGVFSAPLAGVTRGHLVFASGAARVTLRADGAGADLYRAHFRGPTPTVRVKDGTVTVEYKRFSLSDWARVALGGAGKIGADLVLSATVPWAIDLRMGVSNVSANLNGLTLESLEIRGGASQVEMTLPAPRGVVSVRMTGGASHVLLQVPMNTALKADISGGASHLKVGSQTFGAVGGSMHWESPDCASAKDRYELAVSGGASHLTVESR